MRSLKCRSYRTTPSHKQSLKKTTKIRSLECRSYRATPSILGINLCSTPQQQIDYICMPLASRDVQSCPSINVCEVHIRSRFQQLLDPFQIAFICQVHEPDRRLYHLRHLQLPGVAIRSLLFLRRKRRLPAQSKPAGGLGLHVCKYWRAVP